MQLNMGKDKNISRRDALKRIGTRLSRRSSGRCTADSWPIQDLTLKSAS